MLYLLFATLLINYLFGNKTLTNILYCGIFGWNGLSAKSVSKDKLKLLGIYNDKRGGQSIGMCFNRSVRKSIKPHDTFKDYWEENIFVEEIEHPIVIGHSRRASVGTINLPNAQPTVVKVTDTGSKKETVNKIALAHNGTISNYKELAEKFDLDIDKLNTDSQVLAALILSVGPQILSEYIGGASIIYTLSTDQNALYVFRGESSLYDTGTVTSEERPLHYYQEHKNSIYFSSEKGALVAISSNENNIHIVPENILFRVEDGKMTEVLRIDRSKSSQKGTSTFQPNNNWGSERDRFNDWGINRGSYPVRNVDTYSQRAIKEVTKEEKEFKDSIKEAVEQGNIIYFLKGRYYIGENLAHGEVYLGTNGVVFSRKELIDGKVPIEPDSLGVFYFFRGVMMDDESSMTTLIKLNVDKKLPDETKKEYYKILAENSPMPVGPLSYEGQYWHSYRSFKESSKYTTSLFSGKLKPLFSSLSYNFNIGEVRTIEDTEEPFYPKDYGNIISVNAGRRNDYNFDHYVGNIPTEISDAILEKYPDLLSLPAGQEELDQEADIVAEMELTKAMQVREKIITEVEKLAEEIENTTGIVNDFVKELAEIKKSINNFEFTQTV